MTYDTTRNENSSMTPNATPSPPDFVGKVIEGVALASIMALRTTDGWQFHLNSGDYFLTRPGLGTVEIERPEGDAVPPQMLLDLVGGTIRSVVVSDEGDLAINIDDAQVSVRRDPVMRPWVIYGPEGVKLRWLIDEGRADFWIPFTPEEEVALFHEVVPSFEGKKFTVLRWNHPLMMWTEDIWSIDVYAKARLTIDGRDPIEFEGMTPAEVPVPDVSELLGKPMLGLELLPSGELTFRFADAALTLLPDPERDSWCLGGNKGEKIFCDAGGRLMIFGPDD
jgi:hypothetical protein